MSFQYVKIYHGPCDSFHTVAHKPQKLAGLKDRLQKLGYRVDLEPVKFMNYCVLEMCGYEIFRCNIQNLQFNSPFHRDPVCQRAVQAVLDSSRKFIRAQTYFWLNAYLVDQIFKRKEEYALRDYWPFDLDSKAFGSVMECIKCCRILTANKKA